jgi:hypothetical protein
VFLVPPHDQSVGVLLLSVYIFETCYVSDSSTASDDSEDIQQRLRLQKKKNKETENKPDKTQEEET